MSGSSSAKKASSDGGGQEEDEERLKTLVQPKKKKKRTPVGINVLPTKYEVGESPFIMASFCSVLSTGCNFIAIA